MITLIVMALARKTVAQLLVFGRNLITNLTGNADFNDAAITAKVAALTTAGDDLELKAAELAALQSDLEAKEMQVQDAAAAYKVLLDQLANQCEGKTKDPAKLAGGGFDIRGEAEPVGDMPKPSVVKCTRGDVEGAFDVTTPSIRGARIYVAETAAVIGGPYTRKYEGTRSSFEITGAQPGELCFVRVAAIGPKGMGPFSNAVACRAA